MAKVVPVAAAAKKAAPASAIVTPKAMADSAPAGGFFGFLNSAPAPTKESKGSKEGMNVKFLASISKLLKGDAKKIKTFQTATDSFRSGDLSGEVFLKTLETLFGMENIESVVIPLISELPERDAAAKLKASFEKKMSPMKKEAAKAPFSFSFGTPKAESAAPAASMKLPAGVPAAKKAAVENQMKQLLSGTGDAKIFYKNISKDLGRPKTLEIMPEIIKSLPKPIGIKVEAVFKADK